jgi:TetR/AcrR family tetracycline transcriptional repressor
LRRDAIVDTAVVLLDEVGLDDLSTRLLADRLGVRVGALYWHVRDKHELLALVADRIVAEAIPSTPPTARWDIQLADAATRLRAALLHHRDGARVVATYAGHGPASLQLAESGLRSMQSLGLDLRTAAFVGDTLVSYITGFVLQEQAQTASTPTTNAELLADYPLLAEWTKQQNAATNEHAFAVGLVLITSGIGSTLLHTGPSVTRA